MSVERDDRETLAVSASSPKLNQSARPENGQKRSFGIASQEIVLQALVSAAALGQDPRTGFWNRIQFPTTLLRWRD
jgi:hypothetical protein